MTDSAYLRVVLSFKDIYLVLKSNVKKFTGYDLSWYVIISDFDHLTYEVHIPVHFVIE